MENLSLLLKTCTTPDEIHAVKDGFKDHLAKFGNRTLELEIQMSKLTKELETARHHRFSWDNIADQAEKILGTIAENSTLAIKTAYHALFDSVIVGPENEHGIRTIKYVLSDESHEDGYGPRSEMVEAESPPRNVLILLGIAARSKAMGISWTAFVSKSKNRRITLSTMGLSLAETP